MRSAIDLISKLNQGWESGTTLTQLTLEIVVVHTHVRDERWKVTWKSSSACDLINEMHDNDFFFTLKKGEFIYAIYEFSLWLFLMQKFEF